MKKIDKPWGYEEIWAKTDKYVAKRIFINANSRLSLQYHEQKEETVTVISGTLRIWTSEDDKSFVDLNPGDIYHVKPKEVHRFGSTTFDSVLIIEVSTPELDDVVRIKDDYGR